MNQKIATALLVMLFLTVAVCLARENYKDSVCTSVMQGGEITVILPEGFIAERDDLSGRNGNISLYNIKGELVASGRKFPVTGYLSETASTEPLSEYLKTAEKYKSAAIYGFSSLTVKADGVSGYMWRYKVKKEDEDDVSVRAAFFAGASKIYTVQLAAAVGDNAGDEKGSISGLYEEALDAAFGAILDSVKFSGTVQSGKYLEGYSFRKQASSHCRPLFREVLSDGRICRSVRAAKELSDPSLFFRALSGL